MCKASSQILFALLLLFALAVPGLQAQQNQRQNQPRQRQVDPYALAVQYGKKSLNPDKLNAAQRRHYQLMMAINAAIANGDYDKSKVYEAAYGPIAEWMQQAIPQLQQIEENWRQQCEEAILNNDRQTAALSDFQAKLFAELSRIGREMLEAYQKKQSSKLNSLIKEYQTCEGNFLMQNLRPPKRDWLTAQEVNYLSSQLSRRRTK